MVSSAKPSVFRGAISVLREGGGWVPCLIFSPLVGPSPLGLSQFPKRALLVLFRTPEESYLNPSKSFIKQLGLFWGASNTIVDCFGCWTIFMTKFFSPLLTRSYHVWRQPLQHDPEFWLCKHVEFIIKFYFIWGMGIYLRIVQYYVRCSIKIGLDKWSW